MVGDAIINKLTNCRTPCLRRQWNDCSLWAVETRSAGRWYTVRIVFADRAQAETTKPGRREWCDTDRANFTVVRHRGRER